jgi:putative transposase
MCRMTIKHPQPLSNFDYVGLHTYSLTWCCDYRQHHFTQRDHVELVRAQFLRACREAEFAIIADCFMPDHVHQLVKGCSSTADGRKYIRLAKQYSGYYFKKEFKLRLWQRYGHDSVLRPESDPRSVARYIIENPVKGGLAERPDEYPFTGSQLHSIKELNEWAYS